MVNARHKLWCEKGRSKQAYLDVTGSREAYSCATSDRAGMVKGKKEICGEQGCPKPAAFGPAGSRKPQFCATHARGGMVDVRNPECGEEGCFKRPSLGAVGSRKAEFCATHARAGMVNVTNNKCGEEGCSKRASWGSAGGKKAEFCATHARAGMVSVQGRKCGEECCSKHAVFGVAGSRDVEFCATHARAGMVNLISKACGEEGCSTIPSFGVAGSRKAEFCAAHARTGMISLEGKKYASKRCSDRVQELGNFCRQDAAHDLLRASNPASHTQEGSGLDDHLAQGGTSGGIDWRGKKPGHLSSAGVDTNGGSRSEGSHRSLRARGTWRGNSTSRKAPPPLSGQPASAAAAHGVALDDAETCVKVETQMALPPSFGWTNTSTKSAATLHITCDRMRSGSSRSTRDGSYDSGATSGRNMKRLQGGTVGINI